MIVAFSLLTSFDAPDLEGLVRRGDTNYPLARKVGDEVYVATTMAPLRHPHGVIYVSRDGHCIGAGEGNVVLNRVPYPMSPLNKMGLDEILGRGAVP